MIPHYYLFLLSILTNFLIRTLVLFWIFNLQLAKMFTFRNWFRGQSVNRFLVISQLKLFSYLIGFCKTFASNWTEISPPKAPELAWEALHTTGINLPSRWLSNEGSESKNGFIRQVRCL